MADKLVYSSYGSGGGSKSAIRKWYEQMVPSSRHMERAKHHLTVTGEAIRGGGEGLIIGAALGAVHASLPTGLDIKVPMGTGKAALLPADAVLAALALVGSAAMGPNDAVGTDLRNSGIAADFIAAKRAATGKAGFSQLAAHGEDGSSWSADAGAEDPIVAAARRL
jgi:hypothetical protein